MRKIKFIIVASVTALLVIFAASLYIGAVYWRSPANQEVEIKPGTSMRGISDELAAKRVIGTPRLFEIIARARGLGRTMRAGTYEFAAGMTMNEVMGKMARGEVKQYPFTIVEGWNLEEIAQALSASPFAQDSLMPQEFLKKVRDPVLIQELGFEGIRSLEGYLFPDTYFFTKSFDVSLFIKRLVARFREVWGALDTSEISGSNMSQQEIITLASIVEKETGQAEERPLIASVFLNRLVQGMPLQSDPTTIYGLPNFDGNLRKKDMSNPHSYNTYVHAGLPPGPICNPGRASIEAVIHPAHTDFLYFVAKGDGTHKFSTTLEDHAIAVREYQINPVRR